MLTFYLVMHTSIYTKIYRHSKKEIYKHMQSVEVNNKMNCTCIYLNLVRQTIQSSLSEMPVSNSIIKPV